MEDDKEYFESKIEKIYEEILAYLEIDINGNSLLINNESFLKESLLRTMSVGYSRYAKIFSTRCRISKQKISVIQFTAAGVKVKEHLSIRDAEKAVGLSHGCINSALKKNKKSGGFIWMKSKDYQKK